MLRTTPTARRRAISTERRRSLAASFSPLSISGLQLWLDATYGVYSDAGVTPAGNSDPVWQWNDRSGNGRNAIQATSAKQPVYQNGVSGLTGDPVLVTFDSTDDVLPITASNLASPYTLFVVGSIVNPNGYLFDGNTFDQGGISYSAGLRLMTSGGNITGVAYSLGTDAIFTAVNANSASSSLQVNNIAPGTGTCGGSLVSPWQAGGVSAASVSSGGYLAEVLIYNSALSAALIAQVKAYLNQKWGVF